MKTLRLFIGTTLLFLFTLAGIANAATADVKLKLQPKCGEAPCEVREEDNSDFLVVPLIPGSELTFDVVIDNPSGQAIISAQSWLTYDPEVFEGVKIETYSNFNLVAPGEKDFDAENGRIKIGVANTSGGVMESEVILATVTLAVKDSDISETEISFYDYQISELGHTNVNIIEDNFPLNVLESPPKAMLFSFDGASVEPVGGPVDVPDPTYYTAPERPTGVKITTGNSYAQLVWDQVQGMGYNIYYGNQSGYYLHKLDVARTNNFYVTNLNNEQTYYFAIKAYNINGSESDYSNEVAIIINHPDSSTSPLIVGTADIASTKSGPSSVLFIAFVAGACGYVFSRRKKLFA